MKFRNSKFETGGKTKIQPTQSFEFRILNLDIVSNFVLRASNLIGNRGASLLELLIYIAVLSGVVVFLANIFPLILRSRTTTNARLEVQENIRFITERTQQKVWDATSITIPATPTCPLNQLDLGGSPATSFRISGGILQTLDGSWNDLTSGLVTVDVPVPASDCLFTKITNPAPAKDTVQVKLKVSYNDQGRPDLKFSETVQFTASLR